MTIDMIDMEQTLDFGPSWLTKVKGQDQLNGHL